MKKQFFAIVLTIVLVLALMPAATFADEEVNTSIESEMGMDSERVENENGTGEELPGEVSEPTDPAEEPAEPTAPAEEPAEPTAPAEEPAEEPGEEPLEEPSEEPSGITLEELEAVLDIYRGMEKTPFNIRRVMDILGFDKLIEFDEDFEDLYFSDELLMEAYEEASMADVVDALYGQRVMLLSFLDDDNEEITSKINIGADLDSAGTYTVTYGDQTDKGFYTYTKNGGDLIITPAKGFKITAAVFTTGWYYPTEDDDVEVQNLITAGFLKEGKIVITADDFENGLFYPVLSGAGKNRAYKMAITITTSKADAGTITLNEEGGAGANYRMITTSTSEGEREEIQGVIERQIADNTIAYGTKITFAVDPAKIASAKVVEIGEEEKTHIFDSTNYRFDVTASAEDITITFFYRGKASLSEIIFPNGVSKEGVGYTLTANGSTKTGLTEDRLKTAISECYVADEVVIGVSGTDATLSGAKVGNIPYTAVANTVTVTLEKDMVIELEFKATSLVLEVSKYDRNNNADLGVAVFVVATIANYDLLENRDSIQATRFTLETVTSKNPAAKSLYEGKVIDVTRQGPYFAMGFVPKHYGKYSYDYTIEVNTSLIYNKQRLNQIDVITVGN